MAQTVYLMASDKEGNQSVTAHQCWDKALFLESRKADYEKEGGSAVEVGAETYQRHNWQKR